MCKNDRNSACLRTQDASWGNWSGNSKVPYENPLECTLWKFWDQPYENPLVDHNPYENYHLEGNSSIVRCGGWELACGFNLAINIRAAQCGWFEYLKIVLVEHGILSILPAISIGKRLFFDHMFFKVVALKSSDNSTWNKRWWSARSGGKLWSLTSWNHHGLHVVFHSIQEYSNILVYNLQ